MAIRRWILFAVLALLPDAARADTFFVANLDGAQVVPINPPTPATGFGRITLNDAETAIVVSIYYFGLLTNVTEVHLHGPAAAGANGPIITTIPTVGATTGQGVNLPFSITPTAVLDVKAGLYYFDIHTANSPNGEIRGQLLVDPMLMATLSGAQEVPATGSGGTGRGFVSLNAAETLAMVSVRWSGLGTNTLLAHIHAGRPGVNGGILCDLNPPTGATSGASIDVLCPLLPAQVAELKSGGLYFNVHSTALPNGEIRGQIKRSFSPCDFDGDSRADQVIIRPASGALDWWIRLSGGGIQHFTWGTSGGPMIITIALCSDVDGDGKADATIWHLAPDTPPVPPTYAVFWTRLSSGGVRGQIFGMPADDPLVSGDFDGDGRSDYAIYRMNFAAGASTFWILESSTGVLRVESFGVFNDHAHASPEYDGDGKADLALRRNSQYWRKLSSTGAIDAINWGLSTDAHQSADYDGDGRTDIAITRDVGGVAKQWWIRSSLTGSALAPYGNGFFFGSTNDLRVTADYDGDRLTDVAVWTPASGVWWIQSVKTGLTTISWGTVGDVPVARSYWR